MVTENGSVSSSVDGHGDVTLSVDTPARRINENRRSNKPIMEKRRRARINNCLNELKTLILDAMKKDPARHSKLEKADILEMTVKHLQSLQRQQAAMSAATDPQVYNKYKAGFNECVSEVGRFPGLDGGVKRRLLQHLTQCLGQGRGEAPVQVHILPSLQEAAPTQTGIILSNGGGAGVQLLPTRLPNGDIALVLPASAAIPSTSTSPVPLLVPLPPRVSSASSASTMSPEPGPIDLHVDVQKPLALVMPKLEEDVDEKPWRPWNS